MNTIKFNYDNTSTSELYQLLNMNWLRKNYEYCVIFAIELYKRNAIDNNRLGFYKQIASEL